MIRFDRRAFFRYTGFGFLASGLPNSAEAGTFFWKRMFSIPPRDTSFITPNDKFYLVHYDGVPSIQIARWKLPISGQVQRPLTLTYADFLSRRSVEAMVTLTCIDTLPGGSTIGNAVWQGIPLKGLLEEAGLESGAVDVVFRAADGYSDSIPVERIMKGDVLLAHTMNNVALPRDHGYPLRVIAPGLYGIKNVKWLTEIEVVAYDFKGYWQQRGWTDQGHIKIMSRIDSPGHFQEMKRPEVEVRGIAFGGAHGLRRVQVSVDGGKTWESAEITHAHSPSTWILWRYLWQVTEAGAHPLVARATDDQDRIQSSKILRAYPEGSSGLHSITVLVE
jgi:DMSO/TMAO reductase YedYZ molybdopterin-dependent catalytic subunit